MVVNIYTLINPLKRKLSITWRWIQHNIFKLHEWRTFEMAASYKKTFPEQAGVGRECEFCGKLQYLSDDRTHWDNGIRGILWDGKKWHIPQYPKPKRVIHTTDCTH